MGDDEQDAGVDDQWPLILVFGRRGRRGGGVEEELAGEPIPDCGERSEGSLSVPEELEEL
jgi:hypothetical protein